MLFRHKEPGTRNECRVWRLKVLPLSAAMPEKQIFRDHPPDILPFWVQYFLGMKLPYVCRLLPAWLTGTMPLPADNRMPEIFCTGNKHVYRFVHPVHSRDNPIIWWLIQEKCIH